MNGFEQLQNKSQITEKNKDFEDFKKSEDQKKTGEGSLKNSSEEMIGNNEDEAAKMEIYSNPKAESGPLDMRSVSQVIRVHPRSSEVIYNPFIGWA